MKNKPRVPVSERALVQRLNRALHPDGEKIKKTRGGKAEQELGAYYVLNIRGNYVVGKDVDLEDFGRKYKVLADWEQVIA